MKYVKILGLMAVAAAALMAFAGTASATVLKSTGATVPATTILKASLESGSTASLADTAGNPIQTCTSSEVEGEIENAGGASATVSGPVTKLTFSGGATCSVTVTLVKTDRLEIHHIAGTTNGTLTASGFHVVLHVFGTQCTYGAGASTDLGTATGATTATNTGTLATMDVDAIVNRQTGGFLCPTTARWIAKYLVTSPHELTVEAS